MLQQSRSARGLLLISVPVRRSLAQTASFAHQHSHQHSSSQHCCATVPRRTASAAADYFDGVAFRPYLTVSWIAGFVSFDTPHDVLFSDGFFPRATSFSRPVRRLGLSPTHFNCKGVICEFREAACFWRRWQRCILAPALPAQDTTELLNRMRAMEERIKALEAEVQTLKAQPAAAAPVAQAQTAPPPGRSTTAARRASGRRRRSRCQGAQPRYQRDRRFHRRHRQPRRTRPTPSLEMHESEVGFQEVIDPYARADFFLSFGETRREPGRRLPHVHLAARRPAVAASGKMRAAFGKVNTLHNHVLPWMDRPLVTSESGGRRGRHQRRGTVAEPHSALAQGTLLGRHRASLPRRYRKRVRRRRGAARCRPWATARV